MKKILSIIVLILALVAGQANATSIAVNGNNPANVNQGSAYQDQGATATYNDGTTGQISGDTSGVDTSKTGTYSVGYTTTDTDGSGETASASRTVNVVSSGGFVIIPKIAKIVKYSYTKVGPNAYIFNFVGKNIDGRSSKEFIKWGGTIDQMERRGWQRYRENGNIVHTSSDTVYFWVKNRFGTGKVLEVKLK